MKKVTVVLLILAAMVASLYATGTSEAVVPQSASSSEVGVYAGVEPLAEKTHLVISTHAGTHHGFIVYLIQQFGGYKLANIDAEIITFSNGPVQMESLTSNSWDCGTTGIGGVLNGVLRNNLVVLGPAAMDNASIKVFAKNDSDIVKTGPTTKHNVYGTAEQWKGREVVVTTGSTLHYTLAKGLGDLGLTLDDVKVTHMDVASANTALLARKADIGAVWGTYTYGEALNQNYTAVMSASDLETNISVTLVANPNSYVNEAKRAAIAKFVDLYYATVTWVYGDNGANLDKAAEYFTQINENSGITSTVDVNLRTLTHDKLYTLEEAYHMFNDVTDNGTSPIFEGHRGPLEFYVQKIGNYTEADIAAFKAENFDASIVNKLYNK